jgi:hypothetical protein
MIAGIACLQGIPVRSHFLQPHDLAIRSTATTLPSTGNMRETYLTNLSSAISATTLLIYPLHLTHRCQMKIITSPCVESWSPLRDRACVERYMDVPVTCHGVQSPLPPLTARCVPDAGRCGRS